MSETSDQKRSNAAQKAWATRKANKSICPQKPAVGYKYDESKDIYFTTLKSGQVLEVDGATHRAMQQSYSNWYGEPMTANELCDQYGLSPDNFTEYKKIHSWSHDQQPFSKEELTAKPVSDLLNQSIDFKKQQIKKQLQVSEWTEIKKAADKWRSLKYNILEEVEKYVAHRKATIIPKLHIDEADDPYALVLGVMDIHYGKGAWRDETNNSYSREEAKELLLSHSSKLINRVSKYGRPDTIFIPIGSDFFHIDNPAGRTTAGTPQDMDGTPGIILVEGLELAVHHIDLVRQVAPVVLVPCPGNHDRMSSIILMMYLKAWYRDTKDVTVIKSLLSRNYVTYGNTLLVFAHGDNPTPEKLVKLIPNEARDVWSSCSHTSLFTGHLHFDVSRDESGVTWNRVRSLSGVDIYHYNSGYTTSSRGLTGYVIDKYEGQIGQFQTTIKDATYGFYLKNKVR